MNNKILLLLLQECMKNYTEEGTADGCLRLSPRPIKEDVVTRYELLPPEYQHLVSEAWQSFHNGIQYVSFQSFYAKDAFCRSDLPQTLRDEQFLHLIADREFLFFNYNEKHIPSGHCSIRTLLTAPAKCMDMTRLELFLESNPPTIKQSDIEALVAQVSDHCLSQERDKVKTKLSSGLESTKETLKTYNRYMENYKALQKSYSKRKELVKSHGNHHWYVKGTVSVTDEFKNQVPPDDIEEVAKQLSALFYGYLCQIFGANYTSGIPNNASSQSLNGYKNIDKHTPQYWVEDMKIFYRHIHEMRCQKYQYPLIFFYLFTQYQKKIANQTLRKFTIDLKEKEEDTSRVTTGSTSNEAKKIKDEIQLFDYLMVVFHISETFLFKVKYEFFLYTRYDTFQHYAVLTWVNPSQPTFQSPINHEDGVDHFANLLRRNIQLCIPNSMENLGICLTRKATVNSATFAYLLIQDAHNVQSSNRLTQRIYNQVERDFDYLKALYESQNNITQDIFDVFKTYCEKHRLLFNIDNRAYDSIADTHLKELLVYSAYLLEITLKDKLHETGKDNLRNQAERLFADCLLPGVRIVRGE